MNPGMFLDILIIVLALIAIVRGWEIGSLRQLFSTVGFFAGLFLGALIEPRIIGLAHTPLAKTVLTLSTTLGLALCLLLIGEEIGVHLKLKIHFKKANIIDNIMGSVISLITIFFTVWICASIFEPLAIPILQTSINQSKIIAQLNSHFPGAPKVISELGSLIDPNGFPKVFVGNEPAPNDSSINLPSLGSMASAVSSDKNSVVKIQGLGCGGIVQGTGFIVAPNLVMTNAHVIAGIARPYVQDQNGTIPAKAVWFNPRLDLAFLRVNNLTGPSLPINTQVASYGTQSVIIGYPEGGPLSATPSLILSSFNAVGRDIYGQGLTTRTVYELKANVVPGNSGSPLIEKNGDVIGLVFAESTSYNQVGYALTANQLVAPLANAIQQRGSVNTGNCAQ
jgi:S1-C subfamily serine protease